MSQCKQYVRITVPYLQLPVLNSRHNKRFNISYMYKQAFFLFLSRLNCQVKIRNILNLLKITLTIILCVFYLIEAGSLSYFVVR